MAQSVRRPIYLHVGLPKTGTSTIQHLLATNRPALREAGVIYPFIRPEGMFHAAVELRGDELRWGLERGVTRGSWDLLLAKARAFEGMTILSHELLGGLDQERVSRLVAGLPDRDVHVVVTARDLSRQVPAAWQEQVKNGATLSYEEFLEEVAHPEGAACRHDSFWAEQDLADVLRRWSRDLPPDRVHVVVCPPSGERPDELWHRFSAAVGLVGLELDAGPSGAANESLGHAQVELVRRVNLALGDRLGQPGHAHVVKRFLAQSLLSRVESPRARTPLALEAALGERTRAWTAFVEEAGFRVYGDLADLTPRSFMGDDDAAAISATGPAQMLDGVPEALAAMLLRMRSLQSDRDLGLEPHRLAGLRGVARQLGRRAAAVPGARRRTAVAP